MALFPLRIRAVDQGLTPAVYSLPRGEFHVWLAFVKEFTDKRTQLARFLDAAEISRMERFHFLRDRAGFAVSQGLLRWLLGRYLEIPPQQVRFQRGPWGKPALAGKQAGAGLCFNLSHAGGLAAFAFSRCRAVGLDVEQVRGMVDIEAMVSGCFHEREKARFAALAPSQRQSRFFECWTEKEAFVKATGEGFSRSPDSFYMTGFREGKLNVYRPVGAGIDSREWGIMAFKPAAGFAGALAFGTIKPNGVTGL